MSSLTGPEWKSKWICLGLVTAQTWLCLAAPAWSWPVYLGAAYAVGATLAQALFLAVHELTHDLFFRTPVLNRLFAFVANAPLVVPFSVDFRAHHLAHHRSLGVRGEDTDLPSEWEVRWVRGACAKLVWCSLQIVAYAVRPVLTRPQPVTRWHVASWTVQLAFDAALVHAAGSAAPLRFALLCVLLAGGLHPCAGHFLSEHYVFEDKGEQETYSYYGPWNALTWNVGYHSEHHDFPRVPWSRLPAVRARFPDRYAALRTCPSWSTVVWEYVTRPDMGPHRRVVRS